MQHSPKEEFQLMVLHCSCSGTRRSAQSPSFGDESSWPSFLRGSRQLTCSHHLMFKFSLKARDKHLQNPLLEIGQVLFFLAIHYGSPA